MSIKRVELKDFLVFKGEFTADFCPGVNVLIGGNGTGKTTLIKALYFWDSINDTADHNNPSSKNSISKKITTDFETTKNGVYIPEKDILEHAKGLLPFMELKKTGFSQVYRSILISAQDVQTRNQTETQIFIDNKLFNIIGGRTYFNLNDGSFYTLRSDGTLIPFENEASGFKRLGLLGLLVSCGQLEPGSVLFWDEPENSLNPDIIPDLVDILLELSRSGVQIFLVTHSELLASYFSINSKGKDDVLFISLYKENEQIKASTRGRFDLIKPNNLTAASIKLYEEELQMGLGSNE